MGSGPVIICDAGGPPLIISDQQEKSQSVAPHVRIGRKYEYMEELVNANGTHVIPNAATISRVTITQDGQSLPYPNPLRVDVYGDQGTDIIVQVQGHQVTVRTSQGLTHDDVAAWGRYVEPDMVIQRVVVDAKPPWQNAKGTPVRVTIEF